MNELTTSRGVSRRRFLRYAAWGGATVTSLIAIACTGPSAPRAGAPTATTAPVTASATLAPAGQPGSVVGTGQPGGTLTVAAFADVTSLDPDVQTADDLALRSTSMFESLVGQDNTLHFVPRLALSWQASPDAVDWTFKLRPGVKFHDGTPVDAAAIKANYDRGSDPKVAPLTAANFLSYYKSSEVIDPLTIKITNKQSDGAALANIGVQPILSPTAFNAVDARTFGQHPIGTGPFKFREWVPGDHVTLDRFDDYWDGKPKLDSIVFKVIADENTRITAVKTGEVDFIPRISLPLLSTLQQDRSVQVVETIPVFRTFFGIGSHPALQDKRVRQAVVRYGCPRADILKQVYLGHGEIAVGPVPSVSEWYIDYTNDVHYDPDQAKTLLQQAGAQNLSFSAIYPGGDPTLADALTVWQSALKGIGVTMNLNMMDNAAYLKLILDPAADYDLCFSPSQGPIGDFEVIRITHRTGGGSNISHNSNPALDALIDQAQATLDPTQRKQLYDRAFQLVIDDSKQYYVSFYPTYRLLSKRVSGYTKDNSTYYRFNNVTVL